MLCLAEVGTTHEAELNSQARNGWMRIVTDLVALGPPPLVAVGDHRDNTQAHRKCYAGSATNRPRSRHEHAPPLYEIRPRGRASTMYNTTKYPRQKQSQHLKRNAMIFTNSKKKKSISNATHNPQISNLFFLGKNQGLLVLKQGSPNAQKNAVTLTLRKTKVQIPDQSGFAQSLAQNAPIPLPLTRHFIKNPATQHMWQGFDGYTSA